MFTVQNKLPPSGACRSQRNEKTQHYENDEKQHEECSFHSAQSENFANLCEPPGIFLRTRHGVAEGNGQNSDNTVISVTRWNP